MNLTKKIAAAVTLTFGMAMANPVLGYCEEGGTQLAPPHSSDTYRVRHTFSGSPEGTLQSCLAAITNNEDVIARDNQWMTFDYDSRNNGDFQAKGYAAEPGNQLTTVKDRNSVGIALITSESGVAGMNVGNVFEYAAAGRTFVQYENWATFQAQSRNAGLFPKQP